MEKKRLQKFLAEAGVASRRGSEDLIREGRVLVNGKKAKIGESVSAKDIVEVNGRKVAEKKKEYLMLNKPVGYIVSKAEQGRGQTIYQIPSVPHHLTPVGRLDKDTEGLLILTNDGDFAYKISHPKFEIEKTYEVLLDRPLEPQERKRIEKGITLSDEDGSTYQATGVRIESESVRPQQLSITLHIGKHHVVRRIFGVLHYTVKKLRRVRIGSLELGTLAPGKMRPLTLDEVQKLLIEGKNRT